MEKYQKLYEYSHFAFVSSKERFYKIDTKATMYLSVLTLCVAIYGFFAKWFLESKIPPQGALEWALLSVFVLSFCILLVAWYFNFTVLKTQSVLVVPLNDEILRFYHENELVDIYYAMSKKFKVAYEQNDLVEKAKAKNLKRAYLAIVSFIVSLVLLALLFLANTWEEKAIEQIKKEVKMEEKNKNSETEKEQIKHEKPVQKTVPNVDIKAPNFQIANEGLEPEVNKKDKSE